MFQNCLWYVEVRGYDRQKWRVVMNRSEEFIVYRDIYNYWEYSSWIVMVTVFLVIKRMIYVSKLFMIRRSEGLW